MSPCAAATLECLPVLQCVRGTEWPPKRTTLDSSWPRVPCRKARPALLPACAKGSVVGQGACPANPEAWSAASHAGSRASALLPEAAFTVAQGARPQQEVPAGIACLATRPAPHAQCITHHQPLHQPLVTQPST